MYPKQRDSGELESDDDIPVFTPLPSPMLSAAMSTAYLTPKPSVEESVKNDNAVPPARESNTLDALRTGAFRYACAVHDLAMRGGKSFKMPLRQIRDVLVLLVCFLLMGVGPVVLEIGAGVVVVRVFLFLFPMEEEVDEVVGVFGEMVGEVGRWWVDFVR